MKSPFARALAALAIVAGAIHCTTPESRSSTKPYVAPTPEVPKNEIANAAPARVGLVGQVATARATDRVFEVRGVSEVPLAATPGTPPLPAVPLKAATVTPGPMALFDTDPLADTPDVNVAVSTTHVCVSNRGAFGCYTKAGVPVVLVSGQLAGQISAFNFFTAAGVKFGQIADCTLDAAKDGRIVFDQSTRHFFVAFQSRELPARLLIAASKTENPTDGWYVYADDLSAIGMNGADYHWIGVNSTHLLLTELLASGCTLVCGPDAGANTCSPTKTYHLSYTLVDLVNGLTPTRGVWKDPAAESAVPAIHDTTTTDAFYVHRDDGADVTIWAVRNGGVYKSAPIPVKLAVNPIDDFGPSDAGQCGAPMKFANIGMAPQNVEFRDGRLLAVSNVGNVWSSPTVNDAVHLMRFNVLTFFGIPGQPIVGVDVDRIFGRAESTDPPGTVFDYGWPAVATNANADIVIGSVRNNCTTGTELRSSVFFYTTQPDISESALLQRSDTVALQWDMAGAAADPSSSAVYLAQRYTRAGIPRARVTKMLGVLAPDILATHVSIPRNPLATVTHGLSFTTTISVTNQGDGTMPASSGQLRYSPDDLISTGLFGGGPDPIVATFPIPALAPGATTPINVPVVLSTVGTGYLGAVVDSGFVASELSETNNTNPFLASPHGNLRVTVR